MEHHDWDWSDGAGADGDAETADLNDDGSDLGGFEHGDGFGDHFDGPTGDEHAAPDFTADVHHDGGIEEPLGTENATAHYDEALHEFTHDPAGDEHAGDQHAGDEHAGDEHAVDGHHADALDPDHDTPDTGHPGAAPDDHNPATDPSADSHDGHDGHDGHDPSSNAADGHDGHDAHAEALVGTDPDLDHNADHADWHDDSPFPPGLDIHAPEPVDGFPWTDPAALGDGAVPDDFSHDYSSLVNSGDEGGPAHAADLAQYDGVEVPPGADAWTHLLGSEDPATSALARWWSPGS
jgi:hypothetical protein